MVTREAEPSAGQSGTSFNCSTVQGQPGLHSELQDSQDNVGRPCLKHKIK